MGRISFFAVVATILVVVTCLSKVGAAEEGFLEKAADKIKHAVGLETTEEAIEREAYEQGKDAVKHGEGMIEHAKEKIGEMLHHKVKEPMEDTVEAGKRKAQEQAEATKAQGQGIYETIKEKVTGPFHSAKEKGQEAMKGAQERAEASAEYATEAAEEARRETIQGYAKAKANADQAAHKGQSTIRQMREDVENVLEQQKIKAEDAYETVKEKTGETVEHAQQYAHNIKQRGKEGLAYATGAKDEAKGEGETLVGSARRKVKEALGAEHHEKPTMEKATESGKKVMDRVKVR
eukprot:evm.model.NODE_10145_length_23393_cov_21.821014.7